MIHAVRGKSAIHRCSRCKTPHAGQPGRPICQFGREFTNSKPTQCTCMRVEGSLSPVTPVRIIPPTIGRPPAVIRVIRVIHRNLSMLRLTRIAPPWRILCRCWLRSVVRCLRLRGKSSSRCRGSLLLCARSTPLNVWNGRQWYLLVSGLRIASGMGAAFALCHVAPRIRGPLCFGLLQHRH